MSALTASKQAEARTALQARAEQGLQMTAEAERVNSEAAAVTASSMPSSVGDVPAAAAAVPANYIAALFARWIPERMLGMVYLAVSAIVFSVMSLCVSLLSEQMPSFEIVLARCLMQFGFGALSCRRYGVDFLGPREKRFWLCVRGGLGFIAFSCYYFGQDRQCAGWRQTRAHAQHMHRLMYVLPFRISCCVFQLCLV